MSYSKQYTCTEILYNRPNINQSINQSIIYLFEHRHNRKTPQINSEIVTNRTDTKAGKPALTSTPKK